MKIHVKIIIVAFVITLLIIITTMISNKKTNNEGETENLNIEEEQQEEVGVQVTGKAVEEKTTNEYKIANIRMTAKSSQTEVSLTIQNISNTTTKERDVYIKYLDKSGSEIGKTRIHLPKMEKGKELTLSTIITKDLRDAVNYEIEY